MLLHRFTHSQLEWRFEVYCTLIKYNKEPPQNIIGNFFGPHITRFRLVEVVGCVAPIASPLTPKIEE